MTARIRSTQRTDDGFTVVEVTVAIALITIVMTSLAAFFVNSGKVTEGQGRRQTAVHVALSAMDKARSLNGVGLTTGRSKNRTTALWDAGNDAAQFPGVAQYLNTNPAVTTTDSVTPAYDRTLPDTSDSGATASLPTTGVTVTLGNTKFKQDWFLGWCLRQNGKCVATSDPTAKNVVVRVVVAVTWAEANCPNRTCSYVTVSLVSETADPVFDQSQGAPKPRIANPGDQSHEVGQSVALPITFTGGTAPFDWTAPTNLPDGLTWGTTPTECPSSSVCVYGIPKTVTTKPITLKLRDGFDYVSTAAFTWTITPGPTLAAIADFSSDTNDAANLSVTATDGTTPYVYSATGLPSGVSISSSTGKVTGTPTLAGVYNVVFKVVDKYGASDTETVQWTVNLIATGVGSCTPTSTTMQTCTATFTAYGDGPFTWVFTRTDTTVSSTISSDTKTAKFTVTVTRQSHPVYYYNFTLTQTKTGGTYKTGFTVAN